MRLTALKVAHENEEIVMRWVNYSDESRVLTVYNSEWIANLKKSNVLEENWEELQAVNGNWEIEVKPFEIITLESVQ